MCLNKENVFSVSRHILFIQAHHIRHIPDSNYYRSLLQNIASFIGLFIGLLIQRIGWHKPFIQAHHIHHITDSNGTSIYVMCLNTENVVYVVCLRKENMLE